ncbi:hypothetical protein [Citrobacter enshiensis]|uniref:hypothetical protein n=1 Tax=Citrobacter enshiensis TaxID=2971264 RepID=UPI0023E7D20D|nr:hypothetical protein [Citrobacter enshiensis]WET42367.1 hypothetical protein P2W74_09895 [Citrobacter enshiensis]
MTLVVRMFDKNNGNIALDGSLDLPVTMDEQGKRQHRHESRPGQHHPEKTGTG